MTRSVRGLLLARAASAGLDLPQALASSLEEYYRLLRSWNAAINLSGFDLSQPEAGAIDRLLIEPLRAAAQMPLPIHALLDLGSGGGSPAIPLKLARPEMQLVMVEARAKKAVFLRTATRHLTLEAVSVIDARYQTLFGKPEFCDTFDAVTARAIRLTPGELVSTAGFLRGDGALYLFTTRDAAINSASPLPSSSMSVPLLPTLGSELLILPRACFGRTTNKAG